MTWTRSSEKAPLNLVCLKLILLLLIPVIFFEQTVWSNYLINVFKSFLQLPFISHVDVKNAAFVIFSTCYTSKEADIMDETADDKLAIPCIQGYITIIHSSIPLSLNMINTFSSYLCTPTVHRNIGKSK